MKALIIIFLVLVLLAIGIALVGVFFLADTGGGPPQIFLDEDYLGDSDGLMRLEREGKLDELLQLNPATGEGDG